MFEEIDPREDRPSQPDRAELSKSSSSRSVMEDLNAYMSVAKKTPVLSHENLISLSRSAYRERLGQIRILSRFIPCARDLRDHYASYLDRGLQLAGLLEGVFDPSMEARDAAYEKNVGRHAGGVFDDTVVCPSKVAEHLEAFSSVFDEVFENPAAASPESLDAMSDAYVRCLHRADHLQRHQQLFVRLTDRVREYVERFREIDTQTPIDKSVTSELPASFETALRRLPKARQHVFIRIASDAVDIVERCGLRVSQLLEMRDIYDTHTTERTRYLNQIVEANLLLAASRAIRAARVDDRLFDRCQEANIGLMIAADRFKYWRNQAFSTYAVFWCQQRLNRYRDQYLNVYSVPASVAALNRKILSLSSASAGQSEQSLRGMVRQASQSLRVPRARIEQALLAFVPHYPIEEASNDLVSEDDEQHLLDPAAFHRVLASALRRLSPRRRVIFEMIWGIRKERAYDVREVASHFGMSVSDVRRAERQVLEELSQGPLASKLFQFLVR